MVLALFLLGPVASAFKPECAIVKGEKAFRAVKKYAAQRVRNAKFEAKEKEHLSGLIDKLDMVLGQDKLNAPKCEACEIVIRFIDLKEAENLPHFRELNDEYSPPEKKYELIDIKYAGHSNFGLEFDARKPGFEGGLHRVFVQVKNLHEPGEYLVYQGALGSELRDWDLRRTFSVSEGKLTRVDTWMVDGLNGWYQRKRNPQLFPNEDVRISLDPVTGRPMAD